MPLRSFFVSLCLGASACSLADYSALFLSTVEKKLDSQSVMGMEAELIHQRDVDELERLSYSGRSLRNKMRARSVLSRVESHRSELAQWIEINSRGISESPCAKNRVWREFINHPNQKFWVWSGMDHQMPRTRDIRSDETQTARCTATSLTAYLERLHRQNRTQLNPIFQKVVIQGAGPTGLLAALDLYANGAHVEILEKRSGPYQRTQILRLDPKWRATLQFYLADHYNELLQEKRMRINLRDQTIEIPTFELETSLKNQLLRLSDASTGDLRIIHGEARQVDTAERTLVYTSTPEGEPELQIRDTSLVILAGGVTNPLRDELLSTPVTHTASRLYSVSTYRKAAPLRDVSCLIHPGFARKISAQETNRLVNEVCNIDSYQNDTACRNISPQRETEVREFETGQILYVGFDVPPAIERLAERCGDSRSCQTELAETWTALATNSLISQNCRESGLELAAGSTSLFKVALRSIPRSAKLFPSARGPLAAIAAGDSLVSPHFFSASGLSGSRNVIEAIARKAIDPELTTENFEVQIESELRKSINFVLEKGRPLFLNSR